MKYGFVKVAACSPKIIVADCVKNAEEIICSIKNAADNGVEILVLPELSISGYTCGDLFFQETLLQGTLTGLKMVCEASFGIKMLIFVGAALRCAGKLYNCAVAIYNGDIIGVIPKTNIPNYSEFYERRYFCGEAEKEEIELWGRSYPFGKELLFRCESYPALCVGAELCEDLWVPQPPSVKHALAGATLIVNLSASDEVIGKAEFRRQLVLAQSAKLLCGYVYADAGQGESSTDMVFAGHSLIAENASLLAQGSLFEHEMIFGEIDIERLLYERMRTNTFPNANMRDYREILFDLSETSMKLNRQISRLPFVPQGKEDRNDRCGMILRMQAEGLRKRLEHSRANGAVIGISGGLDSCLALLVTVEAFKLMGRDMKDIWAVTMPCFGTTNRTRDNAEALCKALGVSFRVVPLAESVREHFKDIDHDEKDKNVVYENAQARMRTLVLMDLANELGALVVGTGDLSELALGWATYNGDHMSMYAVNASVPKTLVRHLVNYYADISEKEALRAVLEDILCTPVSPELLPADGNKILQETEEIVGPYELHDFFLYYMLRFGFSPQKIYYLACCANKGIFLPQTIKKWLMVFYKRFFSQQFKRSCLPDGPKIGTVTLSPRGDWRMPSDASAALWLKEAEML
ncbi:MAG: NAD(+) synthase [Clostridiales bacterium]|nr:NAD(+) synthase [Clostridiales bacterium]